VDDTLIYPMHKATIELGELCKRGSQLRPHVVWFGEAVLNMEQAAQHFAEASKILAVGTSLTVFPAAGLVRLAPFSAEKYFVSPDEQDVPAGYRFLRGKAATVVPQVVACWLENRTPV